MAKRRKRTDLEADRMLELALTRLVEIVGEAATRLSADAREARPGVPWREIVAMRNRLIHGYDAIDKDILWEVVARDLPALVAVLARGIDD